MFAFFLPGIPEMLIIGLMMSVVSFVLVFPFWKICSKAGFPGMLSIAIMIPGLNIVLLFFLAFAEWPALRQSNGFDQ